MTRARSFDAAAAIIALCAFTAMDSAMSPAQEQVIATLHLSAVQYAWVSAAQFLFIAISAPLIGRCGDVFDKRKVLAVSLGVACAGGLLAWSARSVFSYMLTQTLLTAWVGAQTVAMALLAELAPEDRKASAQGVFQGAVGFFASAALLGAGVVMDALGTLSLFWLPALLALPCAIHLGLRRARPALTPSSSGGPGLQQLDVRGGLMLGVLLALLSIALQFITSGGWMTGLALGCLTLLALLLPKWVDAQRR
uniref:MFS transporter n=1 Tax=Pelomonas sp. KK5 TaxID=1855730 RepID=UPI00117D889D